MKRALSRYPHLLMAAAIICTSVGLVLARPAAATAPPAPVWLFPTSTTSPTAVNQSAASCGGNCKLDVGTAAGTANIVIYSIYDGPVVSIVKTPTLFGWVGSWDTTQVASGNYIMVATACVSVFDKSTCTNAVQPITVTNPTVPSTIPSNCSSDATAGLNQYLSGLANNSTVIFAPNTCYLVSALALENKSGVTVNGNGATIKQPSYVGNNQQEPILTLGGDQGTTVNGLNLVGPNVGGGSNSEGDIGVLMWQDANLTLNGVNVSGVEGDGLDLYLAGGNQAGVSTNVTYENGTIAAGYHAIVPEAVNGLAFEDSTVNSGNIDAEVDFNCQSNPPDCGTLTNPNVGIVNMTIANDTFPSGLQLLDGASCMPVGNWTVANNNFGTGGFDLQMNTTYSLTLAELQACGQYDGLTITGNTSTGTSLKPCCGAGSPYILIQGWTGVYIANNTLVLPTGLTGAVIELWASTATITSNTFTNAPGLWDSSPPTGWPASNVTATGNVPAK